MTFSLQGGWDFQMVDDKFAQAVADKVMQLLEPYLSKLGEPEPEYVSLEEVARRTNFSYDFVYDAVRRGELRAIQKGRIWRVAIVDMRAWMNRDRAANSIPTRSEVRADIKRLMPGLLK
jgi:excisionase family DNA binding protein